VISCEPKILRRAGSILLIVPLPHPWGGSPSHHTCKGPFVPFLSVYKMEGSMALGREPRHRSLQQRRSLTVALLNAPSFAEVACNKNSLVFADRDSAAPPGTSASSTGIAAAPTGLSALSTETPVAPGALEFSQISTGGGCMCTA
jgi:hypothetical protein